MSSISGIKFYFILLQEAVAKDKTNISAAAS